LMEQIEFKNSSEDTEETWGTSEERVELM